MPHTSIMHVLNQDYQRLREAIDPQDRPAASLQPARWLGPEDLERVAAWVAASKLGRMTPAKTPGRWLFIPAGNAGADDMERLVGDMLAAAEARFRREVFLPHNWLLKTAAAQER